MQSLRTQDLGCSKVGLSVSYVKQNEEHKGEMKSGLKLKGK
jgi:hypothetical protein